MLPIALAQHKVCFSIQLPGKQELILEADHESLRKGDRVVGIQVSWSWISPVCGDWLFCTLSIQPGWMPSLRHARSTELQDFILCARICHR